MEEKLSINIKRDGNKMRWFILLFSILLVVVGIGFFSMDDEKEYIEEDIYSSPKMVIENIKNAIKEDTTLKQPIEEKSLDDAKEEVTFTEM
jgi:Icc-related predicted phosphoesterase